MGLNKYIKDHNDTIYSGGFASIITSLTAIIAASAASYTGSAISTALYVTAASTLAISRTKNVQLKKTPAIIGSLASLTLIFGATNIDQYNQLDDLKNNHLNIPNTANVIELNSLQSDTDLVNIATTFIDKEAETRLADIYLEKARNAVQIPDNSQEIDSSMTITSEKPETSLDIIIPRPK